jgi:hypothetical protein
MAVEEKTKETRLSCLFLGSFKYGFVSINAFFFTKIRYHESALIPRDYLAF